MQLGLALPQYDYSVAGERPLRFETIVELRASSRARRASSRSGSPTICSSTSRSTAARPIGKRASTRSSRWRRWPGGCRDVRLGTLVFCEALRPASVLAKALATLDRVSGGRLDVGLGAGWYEPEYDAHRHGRCRAPGVRLDRLTEAIEVVKGLLGGEPFTFDGAHHRAFDAHEPAGRDAATAPARVRRRKGRSPAAAHRRARRRLEHVLDVDARRVPRTTRRVGATRARASVAIRRRCGGRSASTRCAARTSAISRAGSSAWREQAPPGVLDGVDLADVPRRSARRHRRRGARAGRRSGRRSASTRSSLGVGAVPFHVTESRRRRDAAVDALRDGVSRLRLASVLREQSRRRRRMRRRSRSEAPPHTPCSMRCSERVLEALGADRAFAADALRGLDAGTVGREELGRARRPDTARGTSTRTRRESPRSRPLHTTVRPYVVLGSHPAACDAVCTQRFTS